MNVLIIILCAVSITASIFLVARFGIKKKEIQNLLQMKELLKM